MDNETVEAMSNEHTTAEVLYSYPERVLVASIWTFISFFGIIGNTLVIVAVISSRKLQTPSNVFISNLATADLLTCLFLIGKVIGILGRNGWPFPKAEWFCTLSGFMIFLCVGVSLFNLAAISLNRLILITVSYKMYMKCFSSNKIVLMVITIWGVPLGTLLSLWKSDMVTFGYDKKYFDCSDLEQTPGSTVYTIVLQIVFYVLPLVIIITSYTIVFRLIKKHFKKMKANELQAARASLHAARAGLEGLRDQRPSIMSINRPVESTSNSGSSDDVEHPSIRRRVNIIDQRDLEITSTLFIVVITFFLSFTPYVIIQSIPKFDYLNVYTGIFVIANSAVNPLIYSLRHPHFKIVLCLLVKCQCYSIPEPTDIFKRFSSRRIQPFP